MKIATLLMTIILSITSTMALECTALKVIKTDTGYINLESDLKAVDGYDSKYETEIEDFYFTFTKTEEDTYSAKIIMGPDYIDAVSSVANFSKNERFTLAKIQGLTRVILKCIK